MKNLSVTVSLTTLLTIGVLGTGVEHASAAGGCGASFYYGRTETACSTGRHYNLTDVSSASFPYSGYVTGPCVAPLAYSNAYYNPQTTGVVGISQPDC